MNKSDQQLCERVLSPGKEMGVLTLFEIQRNGVLLLALPHNRSLALATLDLYQPQKLKGRLFRHSLRLMVRCGLHRRMSKVKFKLGDKGLFSGLDQGADMQELGFLLSGADSEHRNLIGLCVVDGQRMVVKAGCGGAAEIVVQEYQLQCELAEKIPGVPSCRSFFEIDGGVAYVTELVHGRSPKGPHEDKVVYALLSEWLGKGQRKLTSDIDAWGQLDTCLSEEEKNHFSSLRQVDVVSPAVHGDFAPWNIKMDSEGSIKVLDWEHAELAGMPGWDWLHYHVQRLKLVDGASPEKILARCHEMMASSPFDEYLSTAGLKGHENALLGSYLFYTGRYHSYPREEEIQLWLAAQAK